MRAFTSELHGAGPRFLQALPGWAPVAPWASSLIPFDEKELLFYRATRNMEAALDRGRWPSAQAAHTNLNDGLAREVEFGFSPEVRESSRIKADATDLWMQAALRKEGVA